MSIDESMIKFKGRSSLKQYMPLKPIKRGYKVWTRADETGYICEFQIYTGRNRDCAEKNLATRVVKDLTTTITGHNHKVFFDNFFSSVELVKDLQGQKIQACGTICKDRKHLPSRVVQKNLKHRGDSYWMSTTPGLSVVKWMDKKPICFISNFHDPTQVSNVLRNQKDRTRVLFPCTLHVSEYKIITWGM